MPIPASTLDRGRCRVLSPLAAAPQSTWRRSRSVSSRASATTRASPLPDSQAPTAAMPWFASERGARRGGAVALPEGRRGRHEGEHVTVGADQRALVETHAEKSGCLRHGERGGLGVGQRRSGGSDARRTEGDPQHVAAGTGFAGEPLPARGLVHETGRAQWAAGDGVHVRTARCGVELRGVDDHRHDFSGDARGRHVGERRNTERRGEQCARGALVRRDDDGVGEDLAREVGLRAGGPRLGRSRGSRCGGRGRRGGRGDLRRGRKTHDPRFTGTHEAGHSGAGVDSGPAFGQAPRQRFSDLPKPGRRLLLHSPPISRSSREKLIA